MIVRPCFISVLIRARFSDTTTDVYEVTSGFQCVLLYDLTHNLSGISVSFKDTYDRLQQLENLLGTWSESPASALGFHSPLLYMLDAYEANSDDWMSDLRKKDIFSILQWKCAYSGIEIYVADVEKKEWGQYYEEVQEDSEEDINKYYWKGIELPRSSPSRSPTPEVPEILYGEEEYRLKCFYVPEGEEVVGKVVEDFSIAQTDFVGPCSFEGDPVGSDHDRAQNWAVNIYEGTVQYMTRSSLDYSNFLRPWY